MIITDADRAFSSLLEESTLGQNFNIIVSTLTPENGKYWESLATFIDGLEEFKPREFDLLKIIEIGECAIKRKSGKRRIRNNRRSRTFLHYLLPLLRISACQQTIFALRRHNSSIIAHKLD